MRYRAPPTLPGALFRHVWRAKAEAHAAAPNLLALSASNFIHIAVSDRMPRLHRTLALTELQRDSAPLLPGVATIAAKARALKLQILCCQPRSLNSSLRHRSQGSRQQQLRLLCLKSSCVKAVGQEIN
jgi:hypothetical protein